MVVLGLCHAVARYRHGVGRGGVQLLLRDRRICGLMRDQARLFKFLLVCFQKISNVNLTSPPHIIARHYCVSNLSRCLRNFAALLVAQGLDVFGLAKHRQNLPLRHAVNVPAKGRCRQPASLGRGRSWHPGDRRLGLAHQPRRCVRVEVEGGVHKPVGG